MSNKQIKHGDARDRKVTRLLRIYRKMRERCYKSYYPEPQYYSEKGITICDEWKDNYLAFKEWALNNGYADNLSIDRIDGNKGYSPDNCRWATPKEQSRNRKTNILINHNGEEKTLVEWCELLNLNYGTIEMRLRRGWDKEKALLEPIGNNYKRNRGLT